MRIRWISLFFIILLALGACSPASPEQSSDFPPGNPQAPPTEEISAPSPENPLQFESTPETQEMPSTPPAVEKFVSIAKKDLAGRLKIDAEKIGLIKTEEMTWPDAALGCPAPGKVYAQGQVPGFKIWLDAEGIEHIYHTDWTGQVIWCPEINPDGISPLPGNNGPTPEIGVPIK